jgi:hypothetical protein
VCRYGHSVEVWHHSVEVWHHSVEVWHHSVEVCHHSVEVLNHSVVVWQHNMEVCHHSVEAWHHSTEVWHYSVQASYHNIEVWHIVWRSDIWLFSKCTQPPVMCCTSGKEGMLCYSSRPMPSLCLCPYNEKYKYDVTSVLSMILFDVGDIQKYIFQGIVEG